MLVTAIFTALGSVLLELGTTESETLTYFTTNTFWPKVFGCRRRFYPFAALARHLSAHIGLIETSQHFTPDALERHLSALVLVAAVAQLNQSDSVSSRSLGDAQSLQ